MDCFNTGRPYWYVPENVNNENTSLDSGVWILDRARCSFLILNNYISGVLLYSIVSLSLWFRTLCKIKTGVGDCVKFVLSKFPQHHDISWYINPLPLSMCSNWMKDRDFLQNFYKQVVYLIWVDETKTIDMLLTLIYASVLFFINFTELLFMVLSCAVSSCSVRPGWVSTKWK